MPSADVSNGASPLALTVGSKRLPNNSTWSQRCELQDGQGTPNESRKIPRNRKPSGFQKFGLVELNKLDLSPFCSPGQKCVRRAERREPSGTSFLYRQADACRSPILSIMAAWSMMLTQVEPGTS